MLPLSLASMAVDSLRCLDMWPAICTRAVKKRLAPQGCCPVGDMDCNQAPLPNGWSHHDWPAERTWCHPFSCPTSSMRTWRTRRSRRPSKSKKRVGRPSLWHQMADFIRFVDCFPTKRFNYLYIEGIKLYKRIRVFWVISPLYIVWVGMRDGGLIDSLVCPYNFWKMVKIWQAYFGNRLKPSIDFSFLSYCAELLASRVPTGYRNTLKLKMSLG